MCSPEHFYGSIGSLPFCKCRRVFFRATMTRTSTFLVSYGTYYAPQEAIDMVVMFVSLVTNYRNDKPILLGQKPFTAMLTRIPNRRRNLLGILNDC
jgi:hypothetical protein